MERLRGPFRHGKTYLDGQLIVDPDHVAEERGRGQRTGRVGDDRPTHDHVGVDDEHVILLHVRLSQPVNDSHRLVVRWVLVARSRVNRVVGRHVRLHKLPRLGRHGLPLFGRAAHDPRQLTGLLDLPVTVDQPDRLPDEVRAALCRHRRVERRCRRNGGDGGRKSRKSRKSRRDPEKGQEHF